MKSIVLTEEHKAKLLEMCKVLFPELNHLEVRDSTEDFCLDFEHICVEIDRDENLKIIHWFEFCMTHLLDKISLMYDDFAYKLIKEGKINYLDGTIATGLQIGVIKGENPIDILYKYFKKLKQ